MDRVVASFRRRKHVFFNLNFTYLLLYAALYHTDQGGPLLRMKMIDFHFWKLTTPDLYTHGTVFLLDFHCLQKNKLLTAPKLHPGPRTNLLLCGLLCCKIFGPCTSPILQSNILCYTFLFSTAHSTSF